MGALDKVQNIGAMAIFAGVAYLIWSNWDKITGFIKNPLGLKDGDTDLIQWKCPDGTILENGWCKPDTSKLPPIPQDQIPNYDLPGTCESPQYWDFILKSCVTPAAGKKTCPNGQVVYDYQHCLPSTVKPCPDDPLFGGDYKTCEDGSQVCDIWKCPENNRVFDQPAVVTACPGGAQFLKAGESCYAPPTSGQMDKMMCVFNCVGSKAGRYSSINDCTPFELSQGMVQYPGGAGCSDPGTVQCWEQCGGWSL